MIGGESGVGGGGVSGERSVGVQGSNHGQINTGDTVMAVGALRAVADVAPTAGPVGIPSHVPLFTGREAELAALGVALASGPGVVVQAVHGLGGIGKSTLAARYALLHASDYRQVVWITAEDAVELEAGLRRFALALEPQLDRALTSEALAERATAWLAAHGEWLLILDNVEKVGDIDALLGRLGGGSGRFLITSRTSVGWQRLGAVSVRLDVLEAAKALELLGKAIGTGAGELDGGAELCAYLGHLPLAIVQAGAYIAQNPTGAGPDVRGYLRLLAEDPGAILGRGDEQTDPERTLARIWRVTLDKLVDTPLAGEVLRILAWFAPDAIPIDLIEHMVPQPGLDRAIGRLSAYSMITRTAGNPASPETGSDLAVHRLVQVVSRTADPEDPHRTPDFVARARGMATVLLVSTLPRNSTDPATWAVWRRLIPHIDALADYASSDDDSAATVRLLCQAGGFLLEQGHVHRGTNTLERACRSSLRESGVNHPDTLTCRGSLANAYRVAGKLLPAIDEYEAILIDSIRLLGDDDPDTLNLCNNLACTYHDAGMLESAIPLFLQTLAARRRALGEDHIDTLISRGNLASARLEATGDLPQAISDFKAILTDTARFLGEDHPRTLAARNNLANTYQDAGDLRRATPIHESTLADSIRLLGANHPDTLTARNNLASAYSKCGDNHRAILLYEENLAARRQILGENHPDTLASRNNLAYAHWENGFPDPASIFEALLVDGRQALGDNHPLVEAIRENLEAALSYPGHFLLRSEGRAE